MPSFPAGALQISYFKVLPWKPNKIVTRHKHINWVDNHQMIIAAKCGSHNFTAYGEKKHFNNFPIISLWELSVAMATKPRGILAILGKLLAILNCPYPSIICTKLESYCFSHFGGVAI